MQYLLELQPYSHVHQDPFKLQLCKGVVGMQFVLVLRHLYTISKAKRDLSVNGIWSKEVSLKYIPTLY